MVHDNGYKLYVVYKTQLSIVLCAAKMTRLRKEPGYVSQPSGEYRKFSQLLVIANINQKFV